MAQWIVNMLLAPMGAALGPRNARGKKELQPNRGGSREQGFREY